MYSSVTNTRLQSYHPLSPGCYAPRESLLPGTQPAQERRRSPRRSTQVRSEEAVTRRKPRVNRKKLPAQINFWVFGDFWVQASGLCTTLKLHYFFLSFLYLQLPLCCFLCCFFFFFTLRRLLTVSFLFYSKYFGLSQYM